MLNATDPDTRTLIEDKRVVPPALGLPAMTVHYLSRRGSVNLQQVDLEFSAPVDVIRVGLGTDNRSLVAIVKARTAPDSGMPPASVAAPGAAQGSLAPEAVVVPPEGDDPEAMLARASSAVSTGRYEEAVSVLNQLLNLPPNGTSQQAQELIGVAREGLGEVDRARAEYELYLKLYPNSPHAPRVRARIKALGSRAVASSAGKSVTKTQFWGSASQYYYGGQSRIRNETTIITPGTDATQIDVQDISNNDQSAIVTNVDLNLRQRGEDWDNRFVLRDVSVLSFLSDQPSDNRLSALYGDFKNSRLRLDARLGRQNSASGAVLGRFDGATLHYGLGTAWRLGAFGGTPAEPALGSRKTFYGLTIDNDHVLDGLGFGVYAVEQRSERLVDRRALGNEIRYFSPQVSLFSLLDYDIHFDHVNIASLQSAFTFNSGATVNLLYDYRRSPPLQFTNALLADPTVSLKDRIAALGRAQVEREALGLTPVSKVFLLGGLAPVSKHWQIGSEFRVSSVGGTIATSSLPAAPGTGNVYSYTLQAIGTGIVSPSTVLVFNFNRATSDAYDAWLGSFNARFRPSEHLSLEPTFRYFVQNNSGGSRLTRLSPSLRANYQLFNKVALESEISVEHSRTRGVVVDENSTVLFYYLGYRAEF